MGLTFFGLTSKNIPIHRANVFSQIHDIVFHGNGGYDWNTVYNMPLWLRKFTFKQIQDFYNKEKESSESYTQDSNTKSVINPDGTINAPEFLNSNKGKTSYK